MKRKYHESILRTFYRPGMYVCRPLKVPLNALVALKQGETTKNHHAKYPYNISDPHVATAVYVVMCHGKISPAMIYPFRNGGCHLDY